MKRRELFYACILGIILSLPSYGEIRGIRGLGSKNGDGSKDQVTRQSEENIAEQNRESTEKQTTTIVVAVILSVFAICGTAIYLKKSN
jgi:hypothetical protein